MSKAKRIRATAVNRMKTKNKPYNKYKLNGVIKNEKRNKTL